MASSSSSSSSALAIVEQDAPPSPIFDATQLRAISLALSGKCFFLTGSAGCGKSLVLKSLVGRVRMENGLVVVVTSSTGISAEHIDGVTLNFFAGVGKAEDSQERLAERIKRSPAAVGWRTAEVIVIEECSMVSAQFFDKLDFIARQVRGIDEFFGGLQVIAVGDFFQLQPVNGAYAFQSKIWRKHMRHAVILSKVYRQSDTKFVEWLNQVREGEMPIHYANIVRASPGVSPDTGIAPTKLFCHNANVDRINEEELAKLTAPAVIFRAETTGVGEPKSRQKLADEAAKAEHKHRAAVEAYAAAVKAASIPQFFGGVKLKPKPLPPPPGSAPAKAVVEKNPYPIPEVFTLKLKAQVMLLKNNGNEYKNGTRGMVVGYIYAPQQEEEEEQEGPARKAMRMTPSIPSGGVPLTPEQEAMTIAWVERHRDVTSNGNMDDLPHVCRGKALRMLTEIDMAKQAEAATPPKPPRDPGEPIGVRVLRLNGNIIDVLPVKFDLTNRGMIIGTRVGLPLKLAWALTGHKSQGMTIDALEVDLRGVFGPAQAYVAMSRASSLEGLKVIGLEKKVVYADERVIEYYAKLKARIARQVAAGDDAELSSDEEEDGAGAAAGADAYNFDADDDDGRF